MEYYIYITTNLVNGKQYIGQHKGNYNDSYLGSGTLIMKAIKKYGKNNFTKEILTYCNSRQEADEQERYYIEKYNAIESDHFYNCQEGGTGGDGWRACDKWMKQHPEQAAKMYKSNGEKLQKWVKNNPEKAKENTLAMIEGARQWRKNNPEQAKQNMKRLQEGRKKWQATHKEEYQAQIDDWRKQGSETNSVPVICITTGEVFKSQREANRHYPTAYQANITKCLKGTRKSAGKHPDTGEKLLWAKYVDK